MARSNAIARHFSMLGALAMLTSMPGGIVALAADADILAQPWAKWDYSKEKPVRGGYLRLAAPQYIGKMNPNHWPVLDWITMGYFHEKLMITDGSYKPNVNWLLKSLKYENPTTVLTTVRDGITFHDGSKLTAQTIKFQMDWIMDKANGAWSASWLSPVQSIEVVDDTTLRWKTREPWAGFTGVIANVPGYVMSEAALRELGEKYDGQPQGTGAYIIEEASPGNFVKLKRNPNWWFAKASGNPDMPYFDGIIVNVIPDPSVRLANLRAGKIDVLSLDKSQYDVVKNDPELIVYKFPANNVAALRFNTQKGVMKDIRLRKAVSMAIDRKALLAGTQFGLGRVASAMYPDDHWAHNPELQPVAYDPAGAKKLLAEAGYPNGLTIKGYYSNTTDGQTLAEAVKNMLSKVGIDWQLELLAPVPAAQKMKDLDYDLAQAGWVFIYDPDLMASGLYHPDGGFNFGRSKNDAAIALIEAGRKEVDVEKRQAIYHQLEKVLYDNYEDAWLYWDEAAVAYRKNVRGTDLPNYLKYREAWFLSHPLWFKDGKP